MPPPWLLRMLRLLAALLALVPSASSRRQRGKVSTAAAANSGGRSPLLPGLGSPLHEVGDIGTFDELAMRAIMARPDRVAVKFDMAGVCASCRQLDPVWDMLAAARPGTAWRVNCGEHPTVCLLRQADVAPRSPTGQEIPEPSLQVWDGKIFWRYVGPNDSETLMAWLASSLTGQVMSMARHCVEVEPLPLADLHAGRPTQPSKIAPTLSQYVRSHGRVTSPYHHQDTPAIWRAPGTLDAPPPSPASAASRGGGGFHDTAATTGIGAERQVRMVRLSWSPSIVLLPGFLTDAECDELVDLAQPLLRPPPPPAPPPPSSEDPDGVDGSGGGGGGGNGPNGLPGGGGWRMAEAAWLPREAERPDHSATLHDLMQRVHDLIGVPPDHGAERKKKTLLPRPPSAPTCFDLSFCIGPEPVLVVQSFCFAGKL